jgi:hypothetical protein
MKAWHFVADKLRDGRDVPPVGVKLVHSGELIMCEAGLHASLHPFDALQYAPGHNLCLVECGGIMLHQEDKLVCTARTILQKQNVRELLYDFACTEAWAIVKDKPNLPQVLRNYLLGTPGQRDRLREAARDAARDKAWSAARGVAWDAAWDAARGAAWDAARGTALDAAWGTARYAARYAAWDAAIDVKARFAARVNKAFKEH